MTEKEKDQFEDLLCTRGDVWDNAVYQMMLVLMDKTEDEFPWDMEKIGPVADAVEGALADAGLHICRPWMENSGEEDEKPCYLTGECECESCPMKN